MISAGYHGDIKVWDFKGRGVPSRWEVGSSVVRIVFNRLNGLLAVGADDLSACLMLWHQEWLVNLKAILIMSQTCALVRMESGSSSSTDGGLRVWDVLLARKIDALHVDVSVTALSLSPNMDILATSHVDQNGVYLWVNQSMFSGASKVDTYASGKRVVSVKLPSVSSTKGSEAEDSDKPVGNSAQLKDASALPTLVQKVPDLVTLSSYPKSQWQSLINLYVIKEQNKPIEPPKKPEKAPFFLPSVPSLSGEIMFKPTWSTNEEAKGGEESSRIKAALTPSIFLQALQSSAEMKNFSEFTDFIKTLSPSSLDMELRILQIVGDEDEEEPENCFQLNCFSTILYTRLHAETILTLYKL